jgi:hypothetical protein
MDWRPSQSGEVEVSDILMTGILAPFNMILDISDLRLRKDQTT